MIWKHEPIAVKEEWKWIDWRKRTTTMFNLRWVFWSYLSSQTDNSITIASTWEQPCSVGPRPITIVFDFFPPLLGIFNCGWIVHPSSISRACRCIWCVWVRMHSHSYFIFPPFFVTGVSCVGRVKGLTWFLSLYAHVKENFFLKWGILGFMSWFLFFWNY